MISVILKLPSRKKKKNLFTENQLIVLIQKIKLAFSGTRHTVFDARIPLRMTFARRLWCSYKPYILSHFAIFFEVRSQGAEQRPQLWYQWVQ